MDLGRWLNVRQKRNAFMHMVLCRSFISLWYAIVLKCNISYSFRYAHCGWIYLHHVILRPFILNEM